MLVKQLTKLDLETDKYVVLSLVDPSKYTSSFSVNIFADAEFVEWLPSPNPGHVIILRDVKVCRVHGLTPVLCTNATIC